MADNWERAIDAFEAKIQKRLVQVHARLALALRDSVVFGSSVTGAPGQPVDTSTLKNDWLAGAQFIGPLLWQITTNVRYAEAIENGVGPHGPMILKSQVGGFHSVKLTRNNFQKLTDKVVREVARD